MTHFPTTVPRIEPQYTNPLPILTNTSQSGLSPLASCATSVNPPPVRLHWRTVRTGALLPPTNSTKSTLATHWRSESLPQVCRARHALACLRACGVSDLVRSVDAPKRSHLADQPIFPWRLAPASAPRCGSQTSQTLAAEHQRRNLAVTMPPSFAGNYRSLSNT